MRLLIGVVPLTCALHTLKAEAENAEFWASLNQTECQDVIELVGQGEESCIRDLTDLTIFRFIMSGAFRSCIYLHRDPPSPDV